MNYALLVALMLLAGCVASQPGPSVAIDSHRFSVEIADAPDEWATGLMFREQMDTDKGMLFIFLDEGPRSFWMKNTRIRLDMLFIASNKSIVHIAKDVEPCVLDSCPLQSSPPAQYVLEINGGLSDEYGFKVGDLVVMDPYGSPNK